MIIISWEHILTLNFVQKKMSTLIFVSSFKTGWNWKQWHSCKQIIHFPVSKEIRQFWYQYNSTRNAFMWRLIKFCILTPWLPIRFISFTRSRRVAFVKAGPNYVGKQARLNSISLWYTADYYYQGENDTFDVNIWTKF